jgi:hypothetical protein
MRPLLTPRMEDAVVDEGDILNCEEKKEILSPNKSSPLRSLKHSNIKSDGNDLLEISTDSHRRPEK